MSVLKILTRRFLAVALYFIPLFYCTFIVTTVQAQEEQKLSKAKLITTHPFTILTGGVIILHAKIAGSVQVLNFILDTGCGGISLDSTTAGELKLTASLSNTTIKGISQFKQARFIMNQSLVIGNLLVHALDFHINDYQSLSDRYGVNINGVIGYALLKRYILKVNYDNYTIEFWKPGSINYPKNGFTMKPNLDQFPIFSTYVNDGRPINNSYIFDTGADICFLVSDNFVKDSSVLAENKKIFIVNAEGLGGTKEMKYTTVEEMRVGPYTFSKVPVHIFEDQYNVTRYPKTGGVIGNEILRRFNLIINYPAQEIHLQANSHFHEPFDYRYTGFRLCDVDGKSMINDVVKNSPAEKAGLQSGDLVFGINNNFSNSIEDYKKVISKANNQLKISVLRNNQVKNFIVPIQSIL